MPMPLSHTRNARCLALAGLVLAAALAAGCKKDTKKNAPAADNPAPGPTGDADGKGNGGPGGGSNVPAGWAEARDPVGGYMILLPGVTQYIETPVYAQEKNVKATVVTHHVKNPDTDPVVRGVAFPPPAGSKFGTTPDDLFAALGVYNRVIDTHHEVLSKTPMTLGGKPALRVVLKNKFLGSERLPDDPEFAKEEVERRRKEAAKRTTYYVTTTPTRVIVIEVKTPADPDPALLKTLTDSFAFL
jgi:hypothetical protein